MLNAIEAMVEGTMARVVEPGQGEALDVMGAGMVVKADPARFGALLAEHLVPPGYLVPPHVHDGEDELFFLLDGELTLTGPGGERRIGVGDTAVLPRGSLHGFRNDGPVTARVLVLVTPGLRAVEMFRHFDRAGRAAGPSGLAPADLVSIAAQYGVRISPPPG